MKLRPGCRQVQHNTHERVDAVRGIKPHSARKEQNQIAQAIDGPAAAPLIQGNVCITGRSLQGRSNRAPHGCTNTISLARQQFEPRLGSRWASAGALLGKLAKECKHGLLVFCRRYCFQKLPTDFNSSIAGSEQCCWLNNLDQLSTRRQVLCLVEV